MNKFLKVYYDAEFTGLHRDTTLISIGLVSESGEMFYAEFTDYEPSQVDDWVQDNVIDKLPYHGAGSGVWHKYAGAHERLTTIGQISNVFVKGSKDTIKGELLSWLNAIQTSSGCNQIQFYTDCYAYDWVLMNDLICEDGHALNLPKNIYYIPMDLSTALQISGIDPDITREKFAGETAITRLQMLDPFSKWGDNIKHNSLWDACVCKICFDTLYPV